MALNHTETIRIKISREMVGGICYRHKSVAFVFQSVAFDLYLI